VPPPTPNTRRLVSLATAADMLDVSTKTIRRNIAKGELDAVRLGRKTLKVKAESIERLRLCPRSHRHALSWRRVPGRAYSC
jgi:excisionase family DNA binding protein